MHDMFSSRRVFHDYMCTRAFRILRTCLSVSSLRGLDPPQRACLREEM